MTAPLESVYRLASVGQDCQLLVWEFAASEEAAAAAAEHAVGPLR